MSIPKFLEIDGEEKYRLIVDVLNKVFKMKNSAGKEMGGAYRSVWKISSGKKAWFPYLAASDFLGAWEQPNEKIDWINIPSPDGRTITQIPLAKHGEKHPGKDDLYSVFVRTDMKEGNKFFGVFKCESVNSNGICIWRRVSAALDLEEWKAED